jgi:hypothetical protein
MDLRGEASEDPEFFFYSIARTSRWLYGGGGDGGNDSFSCISSSTGVLARMASSLLLELDIAIFAA